MKQQIESLLKQAQIKMVSAEGENIDHLASIIQLMKSVKWRESQLTEQPKKDLTNMGKEVWKYLYNFYAWEFLMSSNYEKFAEMVSENFVLSSEQWADILTEWELKEHLLTQKSNTSC